jgi:peptidoglycan/LPS O-acetylase OafA/YrhL
MMDLTVMERRRPLPAMDALRAAAALAVVSTHAAVAYMDVQMPGLVWAIHDRSTSRVFDWIFWWCNGVSMPLFFLLAGFFAAMVCDERGAGVFLRHRTKRLLLPFAAACVVILPVTFYVWAGGWLLAGHCTLQQIRRVQFGPAIQPNLYGPAHLWFLEYLLLLSLLFAGVELLRRGRKREPRAFDASTALTLMGATALILWVDPGAPTHFQNSFVPHPARFLYYAVFFFAGAVVFRGGARVTGSRLQSALSVGASLVAFGGVAWLLPLHLSEQLHGMARLLLVGTTVLFVWLSVFGFVGLAQHFFERESVAVTYLAAASYWIYLMHFPIVGLTQVGLSQLPGPAFVKYAVVFGVALLLSLLSYERLVRHTVVGAWLSGTRRTLVDRDTRASAGAVAQAG